MAVITEQYGSSTSTTTLSRRWIWHERPIWPFVWRGLVPLLGLLILGIYAIWPFARKDLESTVLHETRAQLSSQGLGWVNVAVSGQNVTLSGTEPKAGDGDAALIAARGAVCPSWAGHLTCAVDVRGEFAQAPSAPVAAPEPTVTAPIVASPATTAEACEKSLADLLAVSKIEFATGSAAIQPSSDSLLDSLAKAVKECPGTVRIEGHTDSRGAPVANKRLSMARAQAVRTVLVTRGVAAEQLLAEGFGAEKPITDNATETGRAQNRRIEFRVVTTNQN